MALSNHRRDNLLFFQNKILAQPLRISLANKKKEEEAMKNLKLKNLVMGLMAAALITGGVAIGANGPGPQQVQAQGQAATMAPCPYCPMRGAQQQAQAQAPRFQRPCPMQGNMGGNGQGWPCRCRNHWR